ncbi:hypothetical protein MJ572_05580 [Escherichia coli]|nr:hypothetical protein MJ572_05580 [Escherichia coli]
MANSATYGFKSGTASFADMLPVRESGTGVKVAGITPRTLPMARPPTPGEVWTLLSARTVFR